MANQNDVEIAKIEASVVKFGRVCDVTKFGLGVFGFVFSIFIIFIGLKPFLTASPSVIDAIARVIEKFNISNMSGYMLSGGFGVGWYVERKGKKRAIQKKGEFQKMVEKDDMYRSSSGLTEYGDTPRG